MTASLLLERPSAPQRFPPDDTEHSEAVYDLRIDHVMFDGKSRSNLVHLTFPRIFRPRMTDAGGNSRFPAPITHDQSELEFVSGRPAGRTYAVGRAAAWVNVAQ